MKKLPEETIQEVISLYQAGVSPKEIGEKLGVYNNSVTRLLRKRGIERTQAAPRVSSETVQYIIQKYQDGVSSEILAKELNINSSTVLRILKRNNIEARSDSESKRIYPLDESILDQIDCEEKAYFLGLMWSDGNISKNGNDISVRLLSKDQDILRQLSMFFYKKDRVMIHTDGNNKEIATFRICSQKLKQRLGEIGCHPNKTFTNQYPIGLNPDLDRHFIRGVIDGDGSVLNYKTPLISITGTDELLCAISEVVQKNLNITPYKSKKIKYRENGKNIMHLEFHGVKKFKLLGDWIYNNSTIKLSRKYNNYLETLARISLDTPSSNQTNAPYNYGSTDIISYNDQKLTKDYIASLDLKEREEIKNYLFSYFRGFGFPYPKFSDLELLNEWKDIKDFDSSTVLEGNLIKVKNYTGNKLTKHFFENFYQVSFDKKISMLDAFHRDDLLLKVLDNRLGISYKETFNISGAMLRQGFKNSRASSSPSMFMTTVAKFIYDTYAEKDGIVYDYSAGFGQRLVGAMASNKNLTYVGTEPWTESYNNLIKLSKAIFKQEKCNLYNIGSEIFFQEDLHQKVCLAFSSPPYYDTEIYSSETTQCNLGSYDAYLGYWIKTCENIEKMLKPNGCFIINISDKYKQDLLTIASRYFNYDHELYLSYTGMEGKSKTEPVIVMRKK